MTRFVKSLLLFGSIAALSGCNHPSGQPQGYHEPNPTQNNGMRPGGMNQNTGVGGMGQGGMGAPGAGM
ncbi:hypothetical protein [Kozakia baliensis]|uniref:Uncharacterized protein n=1 Tax=Kozakia baliensis TaxID=153496 RepID=A0A1D8UUK6_9PROT|nr:hypothetical protein [Kozakia baliensis]AOX17197.1 hypothetical protein A0U89_08630 [Kozakia baliensis]GBR32334.1 hypothetical protein AA0488_2511 [Kozakia baliensis NRIC 0488]GEL64521.1 hypothetical protein KBA01_18070 [Kozakia baliensis]